MARAKVLNRAEQNAQNRTALLSAARQVFLRSGYHGTTVETVAKEAGFTIGALYSRFDSKADLFLALLEERITERSQQFAGINPGSGQALAAPQEAARRWAEVMRSELDWSLLVIEFRVHAARDSRLAARYAELHERALAALAENIAESLPDELASDPQRVRELARAALAMSAGGALARAAEGEDFGDQLYEDITLALSAYFLEIDAP
jgi:AcrR family transcriptional regulator